MIVTSRILGIDEIDINRSVGDGGPGEASRIGVANSGRFASYVYEHGAEERREIRWNDQLVMQP